MSKTVRKKHINIIKLLSKATEKITLLESANMQKESLLLFVDCQDSAVALGSHIEKLYGMGTRTVEILEEYCECLYLLSVALEECSNVDITKENLRHAINKVQSTYGEEFPEKSEVVFLPYKASMWDSLESVWMAARDDEECEAYVVPIPYYDLDNNHNFKEMHYEADLYPDYVPVTHYEDYDLEERHPDMIFIHNPYDEYNRVTSIAPEFYSSRIKDFTDGLVYIPYFIVDEIDANHQAAVDGIKHFCYLPGTMYADQVIVQSEAMRQLYIQEYQKMAKQQGITVTREELEKKIVGIGSPKLDKAKMVRKEDLDIPIEWRKIIEKPDGNWKKIIFYNTSISAFLQDTEGMLYKIKKVLEFFEKNQDEVALLWRPHPLMQSTIESLRAEVRNQYQEIVQEYRNAGWGIYDDSADVNRAVVLCDAYYGDQSSVTKLVSNAKKPVMIQRVVE